MLDLISNGLIYVYKQLQGILIIYFMKFYIIVCTSNPNTLLESWDLSGDTKYFYLFVLDVCFDIVINIYIPPPSSWLS